MDKNAPVWQSYVEHAELSDVGLRRSNNQDSYGLVIAANEADWFRRGHLFLVADGMGAHAAGELASKMAVDTVTLTYYKLPDSSPAESLRKSIEETNARIHSRGQANLDFRGMGTTSSALALLPQGAMVAHVGDSRVYRLRGNRFEQLSADHSLVWEMMANSKVTEAEMPGYIPKNIITRSLGPSESVQVDLEGVFPLAEGDTFLLCSDGLSGQVSDEEMGAVLGVLPPAEAVRVLVELANLRGGPDNITVIVVRVSGLSALPRHAPAGARSATVGNASGGSPVPWIAAGVLLLTAGVFAVSGQVVVGGVAGAAALFAGLWALIRSSGSGGGSGAAMPMGALGKGPHRSCIANYDEALLNKLNALVEPVCQTARQKGWEIQWHAFERLHRQATAAASNQDYRAATRDMCRAISFLMQEVRLQQARHDTDPMVDIGEN